MASPTLRRGAAGGAEAAEGGSHPDGDAGPLPRRRQRPRQSGAGKRRLQPSCRVNATEYALLTAAAEACGISLAGFLARAALHAARDLDRTAAEIAAERQVIEELFTARRTLGRIGGLLNQAARALNSGGDAPHLAAVAQAVARAARRVEIAADSVSAHYRAEGGGA